MLLWLRARVSVKGINVNSFEDTRLFVEGAYHPYPSSSFPRHLACCHDTDQDTSGHSVHALPCPLTLRLMHEEILMSRRLAAIPLPHHARQHVGLLVLAYPNQSAAASISHSLSKPGRCYCRPYKQGDHHRTWFSSCGMCST